MNWKQHFTLGIIVTVIFVIVLLKIGYIFKPLDYIIFLAITYIYSQLPDIDIQTSKIRWTVTVGFLLAMGWFILVDKLLFTLILLVILIFIWMMGKLGYGHRTICHRISTGFLLSLPLLAFGVIPFVIGLLNFSSHLIADGKGIKQ